MTNKDDQVAVAEAKVSETAAIKAAAKGQVTVKLAHFWTGPEGKDNYIPGDSVTLDPDLARKLDAAGIVARS